MILNLFRKNRATEAVYAVYAAIVAQSRQPRFYDEWGVPDTVTGRFDMICLHMALLFRRLRSEGKPVSEFAQAVFDLFFKDMDRNLREMGATDLGVPKKVRKMTELFYALMTGINEAIDRSDRPGVEAVLTRNVFGDVDASHAPELAAYLFAQAEALDQPPPTNVPVHAAKMQSRHYFDGAVNFAFGRRFELALGVNNLTDAKPSLVGFGQVQANTDPSLYDMLGRRFFASISAKIH